MLNVECFSASAIHTLIPLPFIPLPCMPLSSRICVLALNSGPVLPGFSVPLYLCGARSSATRFSASSAPLRFFHHLQLGAEAGQGRENE